MWQIQEICLESRKIPNLATSLLLLARPASKFFRRVDRFEQKKIEFAWPAH